MSNNPNNLKRGDTVLVEQAWENKYGAFVDEYATVKFVDTDGGLELTFYAAPPPVRTFLREQCRYEAKDYEATR